MQNCKLKYLLLDFMLLVWKILAVFRPGGQGPWVILMPRPGEITLPLSPPSFAAWSWAREWSVALECNRLLLLGRCAVVFELGSWRSDFTSRSKKDVKRHKKKTLCMKPWSSMKVGEKTGNGSLTKDETSWRVPLCLSGRRDWWACCRPCPLCKCNTGVFCRYGGRANLLCIINTNVVIVLRWIGHMPTNPGLSYYVYTYDTIQ